MRNINGYVFIPSFEDTFVFPLFGPNLDLNENRSYSNLTTNGINVFGNISNAIDSATDYRRDMSRLISIAFGKLDMKIAENDNDFEYFRDKSDLITIKLDNWFEERREKDYILMGPIVKQKHSQYPLPGALLYENGYETFNLKNTDSYAVVLNSPFERAFYLATEIKRQGQIGATIATFNLEILDEILDGN